MKQHCGQEEASTSYGRSSLAPVVQDASNNTVAMDFASGLVTAPIALNLHPTTDAASASTEENQITAESGKSAQLPVLQVTAVRTVPTPSRTRLSDTVNSSTKKSQITADGAKCAPRLVSHVTALRSVPTPSRAKQHHTNTSASGSNLSTTLATSTGTLSLEESKGVGKRHKAILAQSHFPSGTFTEYFDIAAGDETKDAQEDPDTSQATKARKQEEERARKEEDESTSTPLKPATSCVKLYMARLIERGFDVQPPSGMHPLCSLPHPKEDRPRLRCATGDSWIVYDSFGWI